MAIKTMLAQQLEEVRKKLCLIGSKESSFISVEILFYDSITISRNNNDPESNRLLTALKLLERNQYRDTQSLFRKSTQKEQAIKRFIVQFKLILSQTIKDISARSPKKEAVARTA